ncbi:hypothetical protein HAX54_013194 [Datura stramonium]|uniref:F-box associated beta-propeller type 3 domain-containing protein n=1 Tax=Datura stramonium TaxID=4076 RepID=A0ABS8TMQ9_DATST|nr:hypothetical protein [Datura stramonium]
MAKVARRKVRQDKKPNKKKEISIRRTKTFSSIIKEEKWNAANGSEFNKLSADVLTSIFLKCSVKTLSISRCISKSWNEIIISPLFVRSHQKQQLVENGPQFLFMEPKHYKPRPSMCRSFVSVDMEGRYEELYTVAHPDDQIYCSQWRVCSGLVCLSTKRRIYLCNPAIHQLRELPNCSPSAIPGHNLFGFGYLDSRKEYKVVHFFHKGPRCLRSDVQLAQLRCEVFTLNDGGISNGRWKEIAEPPPYHPCLAGLLVNECMYWLARDEVQYYAQPRVISFDFVENGKFIAITCPSAFETLFGLNLMDLKGKVCLADYVNFRRSSILDLWILEDKISSTWVKEYSINLVSFMHKNIMNFCMPWNEELMFVSLGMIVFYDLKKKSSRGVKRFGIQHFEIYSKTLFSLDP